MHVCAFFQCSHVFSQVGSTYPKRFPKFRFDNNFLTVGDQNLVAIFGNDFFPKLYDSISFHLVEKFVSQLASWKKPEGNKKSGSSLPT